MVAKPPALNPAAAASGYPHYLNQLNGAGNPHEMQAAYAAAAAAGAPGYPRGPPGLPMGFDPHPQMRAPPVGPLSAGMAGGKP